MEMERIVVMAETEEMQVPAAMETADMVVQAEITGEMGGEGGVAMVMVMAVAEVMLDGEGEMEELAVEVVLAAKMALPVRVQPDKRHFSKLSL
nr:hypothetical protein [Yersinia enterocolitica]